MDGEGSLPTLRSQLFSSETHANPIRVARYIRPRVRTEPNTKKNFPTGWMFLNQLERRSWAEQQLLGVCFCRVFEGGGSDGVVGMVEWIGVIGGVVVGIETVWMIGTSLVSTTWPGFSNVGVTTGAVGGG